MVQCQSEGPKTNFRLTGEAFRGSEVEREDVGGAKCLAARNSNSEKRGEGCREETALRAGLVLLLSAMAVCIQGVMLLAIGPQVAEADVTDLVLTQRPTEASLEAVRHHTIVDAAIGRVDGSDEGDLLRSVPHHVDWWV